MIALDNVTKEYGDGTVAVEDVSFDLDETKTVTPARLQSAADYTMYTGRDVTGWPTHTIVRGEVAYADGDVVAEPGRKTHVDRPVDASAD